MNYARIFTLVQLIASVTAVLQSFYPCQYVDSNKNRLKCDLCQCSSNPATDAVSNLCSFQSTRTCSGQLSDPLEPFLINDSFPPKTELELDHFSDGAVRLLFEQPHFCSTWNFSRLTFVHLKSNLSFPSLPHCLATIESLLLINSFLTSPLLVLPDHLSTLILLNTTWNTARINFTSIETLHLSSVRSLGKPLELHSLSSLIHLTITHIANYVLRGSFPHLSYLNLAQTNLTDQRWNQILSNIQVPDLTTLMLSGNQLTVVTNRFPSTVRYLDLSVNQIKALDYYSFKSLYSLNVLNLSSNSPLEIQQETFTRIPYLEVLDLSFCSPSLDFEELFQPLQKLRHLNISANQLDTFPLLPVPYDAHTIDSYDQQLPVLHVDLSKNDFAQLNAEMFLSSSTQDKYTLEIKIQSNQVKTLKLTSAFFNETKRRGPFIELDLTDNPLQCDCHLYESVLNVFKYDPTYQKQSLFQGSPPFYPYVVQNAPSTALRSWKDGQQPGLSTSLVKQARLKLLHLSNLKCTDMMEPSITRSLVDLHSFDSFCFYNIACPPTCPCCSSPKSCFCQWQCPSVCSCQHSSDFIVNHVNCSSRQLPEIPRDIPSSTTHLDLNHNRIKALKNDLVHLTHLKDLSLAHNRLESLTDEQFSMLTHLERLDLSANMIETISSMAFSNLHQLQRLHLHGNPWRPHFYNNQNEFQSNVRLALLSYASGSTCNRSSLGTALSHKDCCQVSTDPSCQPVLSSNRTELKLANALLAYRNQTSSTVLIGWFDRKYRAYSLVGISICLLLCICCILLYLHQRRRSLLAKSPFLSKNDMGKKTNHYDKPLISSRRENSHSNIIYDHRENDRSLSVTDEDDYASIPLTISQTDLAVPIRASSMVPPLPPRLFFSRRATSPPSSTVSTSTTSQSTQNPPTLVSIPIRSCLQIKLDVLVLYAHDDRQHVHEDLGQKLEMMYGKRFSFYFIHRDRMVGELDWLIENSCVTLLVLRQPQHVQRDYAKIFATCPSMKCFIIVSGNDQTSRATSLKVREKLAGLYRTSDIYDWNANANSLIHEQLEMYLELNCGSATYVPD